MPKYVYPAIFEKEPEGGYSVYFPDIEGCYTQGEDLAEAVENAEDALCLALYDLEEKSAAIKEPSDISALTVKDGDFTSLVSCDTVEYRRYFDNKAVKKTLTIPNWLNVMSERANINFSAVLQKALMQELNIER
ncbi:MAG: type II toxin-antitoxin system HicB family antitoxin [Ruminococcus sp.]|nr:type II toxin-antitoxin system HicB family antitoxin [Ruminococcus sp.]